MTREVKESNLTKLTKWERGIKVESRDDPMGFAYLWFYEWHLFDAVSKGEHTHGSCSWKWTVDDNGRLAQMDSGWLKMAMEATDNGAEMVLEIRNTTNHDWPEIAAIIPCFNPGNRLEKVEPNPIFLDEEGEHTYFLGEHGLELIRRRYQEEIHFSHEPVVEPQLDREARRESRRQIHLDQKTRRQSRREIHFNHEFRPAIMGREKEGQDGKFVFSRKWPTSDRDAYAGLMVRESEDQKWVMGIAWESFISAQGHNPWKCMHLSVRVGPLSKGEKKTIHGRLYLFRGSKEDCLARFKRDFSDTMKKKAGPQDASADASRPRR